MRLSLLEPYNDFRQEYNFKNKELRINKYTLHKSIYY